MKIKPNYLYRVLGDLEKEGRVKKDGRQYYPAAGYAAQRVNSTFSVRPAAFHGPALGPFRASRSGRAG